MDTMEVEREDVKLTVEVTEGELPMCVLEAVP
jgi:hypothetical protein